MPRSATHFQDLIYLLFFRVPEAATGGIPQENVLLEISQNVQENTCARVSFLIILQA